MINPAAIPISLKALGRWIGWKRAVRDGKPTKLPVNPRTKEVCNAHDPENHATFDEALALSVGLDGIGFDLIESDPITGIDLDHCIGEDGKVEPWADSIVDCFASYTEISPSGRGIRIFIRGKLPTGVKHKVNGQGGEGKGIIEVYDHDKFLTVTGNAVARREVEDRQAELDAFCRARLTREEARPRKEAPKGESALSDEDVVRMARTARNGDKFARLYDQGELSDYNGDWSGADLALSSMLAFWASGDAGQVDRLFRASALMRDKWDDPRGTSSYGGNTITLAMATIKSVYDPSDRPTERAARAAAVEDPVNQTDRGNVHRLADRHAKTLRFCREWNEWISWEDTQWKRNLSGAYQRAWRVSDTIRAEAAASGDDEEAKALSKWAMLSEDRKRIEAVVALAKHDPRMVVELDALDADPWLLNCRNGTVDLRTGRLLEHRREDLITKMAPVDYDPDAACPLWERVVGRVMGGDAELVGFLRRALGYAISGVIAEHAIFFLYGTGRNGKSTVLDTVLALLGDYATTVNADLITANKNDQHPTGLCDLDGRRFVPTIEVEDGKRMAEALVKKLTGGDRIKARRMRQDFYEFSPTHKIFLAANHKPEIRGTDEGIWSRIKLIPFSVFIPPEERIKGLAEKLIEEGPGILAWIVRGCLEWQSTGLAEPESVKAATQGYRTEMDELGDFLAQCCNAFLDHPTLRDQAKVKANDLYRRYDAWCKDTGLEPLTARKFGGEMERRGFQIKKSNSQCWRHGITIIEGEE